MTRKANIIEALTALENEGRIRAWVHDPEDPEDYKSRGSWIIATVGNAQFYLTTAEVEGFLVGTTV